MPVRSHHTLPATSLQAADLLDDAWTTELLPRLPANFQTKAHELQVFQRARGLASPSDLLRGLLAYALHGFSSRAWGAWAVLIGLATISDRAWCGWLRRASPWLLWLVGELLAAELPATPLPHPSTRRILLVDATRLPLIGGRGDAWRLHLAYDLLAARMAQVRVSDQTTAERLTHFEVEPGDIHVADSGYGYRVNLLHVVRARADVVLRIHPATCPLEDEGGQPFDVLAWLERTYGTLAEWSGWCRYRGARIRVRLIASKVPVEQAAKARKRKRREAKKAGRRIRRATLVVAGWWLLLTTLAAHDWPATEIVRLYQARWQIELVFKRLKQLLRVQPIRAKRQQAVEATIRALVVAWALQEQLVAEVRALLPTSSRDPHAPASSWLLATLGVESVRTIVRGSWTLARIRTCLPLLVRLLVTSRRKRREAKKARCARGCYPGLAGRTRSERRHDGTSIGKVHPKVRAYAPRGCPPCVSSQNHRPR